MSKLQTLTIDLRAESGQFNKSMELAKAKTRTFATQAHAANDASKRMSGGFKSAANQAAMLQGPLGGVAGRLSAVSAGLSAVGVAGLAAGAVVSALAVIAGKAIGVFAQYEQQSFKLEALLRSTGNAAGLTLAQLEELASTTAFDTLANPAGVKDAIAVLLTFKTVQGETFKEAIALSQDLSAVMGGDIKSAAQQLGKALEDPTTGLNALKRSGVSFTQSEKDLIRSLQETNRLAEAQELILDKLGSQIGGAGQGEAKGLTGTVDTLGQEWEELLFSFAKTTGVADRTNGALGVIATGLGAIKRGMDPSDEVRLYQITKRRLELQEKMREMGRRDDLPAVNPFGFSKSDWYNVQREHSALSKEARQIQDRRNEELRQQSEAQAAAERTAAEAQAEAERARFKQRQDAAAKQLQKDQQIGAQKLAALDMGMAAEDEKIRLGHQRRLQDIETLQLSQQDLERAGHESIELLRAELRIQSQEKMLASLRAIERRDAEHQQRLVDQQLRADGAKKKSAEKLAADQLKTEQDLAAAKFVIGRNALEMGAALAKEGSKGQRVLLAASKGLALAESVLALQTAIGKANAMGFPANIPLIAQATTIGLGAINTIKSVGVAGMAHDGIDYIPREGTWLLDKGERVLSPKQNADFTRAMNGGGMGGVTVIVNEAAGGSEHSIRQENNNGQLVVIIDERIRSVVNEDVARGVGLSRGIEQAFGLTRRGVG